MQHKFGARTILIPLLAIFGFYIIQFAVTTAYVVIYAVISAAKNSGQIGFTDIIDDSVNVIGTHSNYIFIIFSVFVIIFASIIIALMSIKNKEVLRRKKTDLKIWVASFFVIIATSGVISLQLTGIQALGEYFEPVKRAMENYIELSNMFIASDNIWLIIFSTCILVPIAEELIFRGIVQGELSRVMPGVRAVIIQSVIFAAIHIDPIQVSYVLIPALVLGAVYEWTKSIYIPIFLHMVFNFTGAALPVILAENEKAYSYAVMATLAIIPVGIFGMLYIFKKRYKTESNNINTSLKPGGIYEQ